jgi:hypothetical protein
MQGEGKKTGAGVQGEGNRAGAGMQGEGKKTGAGVQGEGIPGAGVIPQGERTARSLAWP